jgi:hypothetical protein
LEIINNFNIEYNRCEIFKCAKNTSCMTRENANLYRFITFHLNTRHSSSMILFIVGAFCKAWSYWHFFLYFHIFSQSNKFFVYCSFFYTGIYFHTKHSFLRFLKIWLEIFFVWLNNSWLKSSMKIHILFATVAYFTTHFFCCCWLFNLNIFPCLTLM